MRELQFGPVAGLTFRVAPSAVVVSVAVWLLLAAGLSALFGRPWVAALIGGLIAVGLHWLSELWHQLGHAAAARRTGHPMLGIRFTFWLGLSVYPADEPPLPPEVHVRRALGGPAASLLLAGIGALGFLAARTADLTVLLVALFFFLDNLLFFFAGALLPLGFTDGSTLLTWLRRSRQS